MNNLKENRRVAETLDKYHQQFNRLSFIEHDPISIPHQFSKLQDIEIIGFWTAMLSWGQRVTIINKCNQLIDLMDGAPHDFIIHHQEADLKRFKDFKHRTFNYTDTLYFIRFFRSFYQDHQSLEEAFVSNEADMTDAGSHLSIFHERFFSLPGFPNRTMKHVSTPLRNSTCKRLNMFLRWMVRSDENGVDFGLWKKINRADLLCPLDVHVDRVARRFGLIERKQTDWKTVLELTQNLKQFDPEDPVKYDYALFGLGVMEKKQTNF